MLNHSSQQQRTQVDLQAIAQEAQYLRKLSENQVLRLILAGTVKRFPGQSVILEEGSRVEEVYLILQGTVSVGLYAGTDPTLWLYVSGPGTILDMCALLDPPVSPVTIRALTDIEVLAIPREIFAELMGEEPAVGYEILRDYSARLSLITQVTLQQFAQEYPGASPN